MADKDYQLGDAPIEHAYRDKMNAVARGLDEFFNGSQRGSQRQTGFVLLVFPFNDHGGRCNFISNGADRSDIIVLFREMIRRFEGGADVPPGHA